MRTKKSLRQEIRTRLAGLSLEQRQKSSLLIQEKLFRLDAMKRARVVCFYIGMSTEVDTAPMVEKAMTLGKKVLVPRVYLENKELKLFEINDIRTDLVSGALGSREPDPAKAKPVEIKDVDCVIVPGLAFDEQKHRLGRGAGYYDRFLAKLPPRAFKVGLAFSFQVFPEIPHEAHDQILDEVITEK